MDMITEACNLLALIAKRKRDYERALKPLQALQGDFNIDMDAMDAVLEDAIIKMLDKMLGAELASYWLYECDGGEGRAGRIEDNGKEWRIKSIGDVRRYAKHCAKLRDKD